MQPQLAVGLLAHVDAGKTTLSEALLYRSGSIDRLGRVDHRDAFLDTDAMERKRGITIFSKQAVLTLPDRTALTLLDTPGHVDFSTEMERTLQVLDYAVLVVSGSDGVQAHTHTLWQLLARYGVPTFVFVNKMDQAGTDPAALLAELKERLSPGCVAFSGRDRESLDEDIALCDEAALAQYLDSGRVEEATAIDLIRRRLLFPCYFGAALRLDGVDALLEGLARYARPPAYPDAFGAKVYKISRDAQNARLTHLKITGGRLAVRDLLTGDSPQAAGEDKPAWTEKVNQIRIYSGETYRAVDAALPGTVCAVTGLTHTYPGQGLGIEAASRPPALEPVLSYRVILPAGCEPHAALRQLRALGEEDPQLAVSWVEASGEIALSLMGEVQLEVLRQLILDRFGLAVDFDAGSILYRETIAAPVIGIGHFEPLRHYAEVQLLLEPGPRGSGLQFATACSEDHLARSWQRLILTHLAEREHPGVLTGAPVTDMKITLLTGRAHLTHTEGGDFRQATYRAVRQGLMQAKCVLLEPWYRFRLELPTEAVGRAMTDLQRVSDDLSLPQGGGERALLTGSAPVAALREYAAEVGAYTRGEGRLSCTVAGFAPCHNQDEVVAASGYDPARDVENPADSVFCAHGAGFTVKWDEVAAHAHLDAGYRLDSEGAAEDAAADRPAPRPESGGGTGYGLDKELRDIFERTYGPIERRDLLTRPARPARPRAESDSRAATPGAAKKMEGPDYLLVDGYNIIHAWEDLRELAAQNMDAARKLLMDILSNYRSVREREIILVFDAYKVPGRTREVEQYHKINVVYTQEAETADAYIEKVTYRMGKRNRVTVATSDSTVQLIIWGHGALRITPGALREEIEQTNADLSDLMRENNRPGFSPSIKLPE